MPDKAGKAPKLVNDFDLVVGPGLAGSAGGPVPVFEPGVQVLDPPRTIAYDAEALLRGVLIRPERFTVLRLDASDLAVLSSFSIVQRAALPRAT